ncbi:Plancitoxin-1 [Holothuria leucospilota]|uniref:Plancitoxin-1 n=1 Tax=Holothuria leucospilota TaxID=206669 RepID=A0A9Q1C7J7_HOLLE|nr:Plancitoxin-1 [Holothuria leucospilota]
MSRATIVTSLFVLTVVSEVVYIESVTCRDMNGMTVDWFYVYKLPKITTSGNVLIKTGVAFYYLDYNRQTFQLSTVSIENLSQPVAQTLQQIYTSPAGTVDIYVAHIMYNDQPPSGRRTSRGHTKGVVSYDGKDGFWMVHSVPKFPGKSSPYQWPGNANTYGQSILCVSFKSPEMENIANQMLYNNPYVYSSNIPSKLKSIAPTFQKILKGEHVKSSPWFRKTRLQSRGGEDFTHYAKYRSFGKDLYVDLVAKDLSSTFYVETWRRRNVLPSDCTHRYHVYNILDIKFSPTVQFSYTKDHSKWAISESADQVICIGDINREKSQFKRGGGTLCANLPQVWNQYYGLMLCYEACVG